MISNKTEKQVLLEWDDFKAEIFNSTVVDASETIEEKKARMQRLEKPGNEEEWFAYYFPKYCFAGAAPFHVKSTRKIMKAKRLYQVRAWCRGMAKSTRRMMEVFYLSYVKKHETNCLLISKSQDNAERLLAPYKINLEVNQRLRNDYGDSEMYGKWTATEFITKQGKAFRAVGAEQNPRGAKIEERRPNLLLLDDIDDDEVCRNPDRVKQRWDWIDDAAISTVEMSKDYYIFFDNNIIADYSLVKIAMEYADDIEIVNIRDENGVSSWPQKNKESDIDYLLSKKSWASVQKEYFNNPVVEGKTIKSITWGKVPKLSKFKFLVSYADPATSNKDKATGSKQRSYKSNTLVGYLDGKWYLVKCFLDQVTNNDFVDWFFAMDDFVAGQTPIYPYIENNTLQDPYYQDLLLPIFYEKSRKRGKVISIRPDTTKKADKFVRCEVTLEPLFRLEQIIFNEEEKNNPHMKTMVAQCLALSPHAKQIDGPDCLQGGIKTIERHNTVTEEGAIVIIQRKGNNKRL